MAEISIVIPVHNAEPYLKPCLDCIAKQTLRDFECICVNDASTDESRKTIEAMAKIDKRFSVVDIPASGAGAARNRGMELAKGTYLMFLDADDLFAPTMLEKLYRRAEETNADIVFCKHQIYEMQKDLTRDCTGVPFPEINPKAEYPFRTDPSLPLQSYAPAPWNKFFRASFVKSEGLQFQVIPSANDIGFTTKAKLAAHHVATIAEPLVFYRTGQSANITAKVHKDPTCVVQALDGIWQFVEERGWTGDVAVKFVAFAYPNLMYTVNLVRENQAAFTRFWSFLRGASIFKSLDDLPMVGLTDEMRSQFASLYLMKMLSSESFASLAPCLGERLRKARSGTGPKVTVVIPCFNAGSVIERTVSSVQRQTLKEIEIIVVDDGSTDDSLARVQAIAKGDSRVLALGLSENAGTFVVRKVGSLAAIGKYITYLDADDEMPADACETLFCTAEQQAADVVHGQIRVHGESHVASQQIAAMEKMVKPASSAYAGGDILTACFCGMRFCGNVCAKLFRRQLMQDAVMALPDERLLMAEDLMQFFAFAARAHKYVPCRKDVYLYHYGRGLTGRSSLTPDDYRKQCAQVRILSILRKSMERCNLSGKPVLAALESLTGRLYSDSYSRIFAFLSSDEDRRTAFGHLLEAATPLGLISWLASKYFNQRDKFILEYDRLRSRDQIPQRSIKTIGILYFHLTAGGVQRVIALLLPVFLKLGYKVVLILEKAPDSTCYQIPDGVQVEVLHRATAMCGPSSIPIRLEELKSIIERCSIDMMYYHPYSSNVMPWDALLCKLVCRIPFVLHFHNCIGTSLYMATQTPEFTYLAARMRMCDQVVVLSRTDELFLKAQGVQAEYVPNPVDERLRSVAGNDWSAAFATKTILWVARISWEKHPIDPIRIFSIVHKRIPEAKLIVVGGGSAEILRSMESKIADEGLSDCVTLAGSQMDTYPFYRKASVFLMTSAFEGFPMTLVEAGAHGLPTVMYALPFLEAVRDNNGVVQVAQGDVNAAASVLCNVLSDEQLYHKMSADNLSRIQQLAQCDQSAVWRRILATLQNSSPEPVDMGKVPVDEIRILLEELQYCHANGFRARSQPVAQSKNGPAQRTTSLEREIMSLKNSTAYRVGMFITWPARKIWRCIKGISHG